jgi:predicted N-acetyltransferase YhbS
MTVMQRPATMNLTLRRGTPADAARCGEICYQAFHTVSTSHNFPPDFPNVGVATDLISWIFTRDDVYSVIAEIDGEIAGSNFLWEGGLISGVGPITVDPKTQNSAIGRRMMEDVLARARQMGQAGVRLVQAGYHNRSLSLYAKLGFVVREPLALMSGKCTASAMPGFMVRPATAIDIDACNALCWRVHGHNRDVELRGAVAQQSATVIERHGRITGYATQIGFFGHAVGETSDDLKALLVGPRAITGPGFLLPTRQADVFRWCLENGYRVVQPMNLMSLGLYNEPAGAFLPSILY